MWILLHVLGLLVLSRVIAMARPMSEEWTPEEYEAAREEWMRQGEDVVLSLAASGQEFAFHMVRKELPEPLHRNWYGPLMNRQRVREVVEPVAWLPSRTKSRNSGRAGVYRLREDVGRRTA